MKLRKKLGCFLLAASMIVCLAMNIYSYGFWITLISLTISITWMTLILYLLGSDHSEAKQ